MHTALHCHRFNTCNALLAVHSTMVILETAAKVPLKQLKNLGKPARLAWHLTTQSQSNVLGEGARPIEGLGAIVGVVLDHPVPLQSQSFQAFKRVQ
jgi:hypothetical protein